MTESEPVTVAVKEQAADRESTVEKEQQLVVDGVILIPEFEELVWTCPEHFTYFTMGLSSICPDYFDLVEINTTLHPPDMKCPVRVNTRKFTSQMDMIARHDRYGTMLHRNIDFVILYLGDLGDLKDWEYVKRYISALVKYLKVDQFLAVLLLPSKSELARARRSQVDELVSKCKAERQYWELSKVVDEKYEEVEAAMKYVCKKAAFQRYQLAADE